MTVYYQHIGERLSARDFPKSLGDNVNGLKRFSYSDIEPFLENLSAYEVLEIQSRVNELAPTGFQIWGIPSGATFVLRNMEPGDFFAFA